ncbi:MAG: DUF3131 domain-containing protein [Mariprofundaceae bacterium]|nr:DUF3131 domain-containing protein [Mariprofundaceae bacterium]
MNFELDTDAIKAAVIAWFMKWKSTIYTFIWGLLMALAVICWPYFDSKEEVEPEIEKVGLAEGCIKPNALTAEDKKFASVAWKYFENNYQAATGFTNSTDGYPSTTMWDTGSVIAAMVTARELKLINAADFHQRMSKMLSSLSTIPLFDGEAPNKVYHAESSQMVDYGNKLAPKGIGTSILDLARLVSWLNILSCLYPEYHDTAMQVITRWSYCRTIRNGQMYGFSFRKDTTKVVQEGRVGYEQYAGAIFEMVGFDQRVSKSYENKFRDTTEIYGVPVAFDKRDAATKGANNYVVTESYVLDIIENGEDPVKNKLMKNIFNVQKKRWQDTGVLTAVSEDNIDREPWFLYNTIYVNGDTWATIKDDGKDFSQFKSLSVKAAYGLAVLFPEESYSKKLLKAIRPVHDPEKGWYSGIYEDKELSFNKALSGNTNGIILETILYKMYGTLKDVCKTCGKPLAFTPAYAEKPENLGKCFPLKMMSKVSGQAA